MCSAKGRRDYSVLRERVEKNTRRKRQLGGTGRRRQNSLTRINKGKEWEALRNLMDKVRGVR